MSEVLQNPLSPEMLDAYQTELRAALPEAYPDEGERRLVETVLIPEFRAKINLMLQIFQDKYPHSDDTISLTEIDELCSAFDLMIRENAQLLDLDGIFKPAYKMVDALRNRVREVLKRNFYQYCRALFAEHGVVDRVTLFEKGFKWFIKATFGSFGQGIAFGKKIMGHSIKGRTNNELHEIADILGYPPVEGLGVEYHPMDEAYFSSEEKIRNDLETYARAGGHSLEETFVYRVSSQEVLCENGERVKGQTYLRRAGIALGFAKKSAADRFPQAATLTALKKKIGVTLPEKFQEMDATYFANIDHVRDDLEAYAKKINCTSIGDVKASSRPMQNAEILCANGEAVKGFTYLRRAAVALGIAANSAAAKPKEVDALVILKEKLGIETKAYPPMDKAYFSLVSNVLYDMEAYAKEIGVEIIDITTKNCASVGVVCSNGETVRGGTYIRRGAIAFGFGTSDREVSGKTSEALIA